MGRHRFQTHQPTSPPDQKTLNKHPHRSGIRNSFQVNNQDKDLNYAKKIKMLLVIDNLVNKEQGKASS